MGHKKAAESVLAAGYAGCGGKNGVKFGHLFRAQVFYKTASGQKLVPVLAWFSDYQKDIQTAEPNQFSRLGDVLQLLDRLASNR